MGIPTPAPTISSYSSANRYLMTESHALCRNEYSFDDGSESEPNGDRVISSLSSPSGYRKTPCPLEHSKTRNTSSHITSSAPRGFRARILIQRRLI
jgi:hypothetical protein